METFRKEQLKRLASGEVSSKKARTDDKPAQDTHSLAKAIEEKNVRMAAALGLDKVATRVADEPPA